MGRIKHIIFIIVLLIANNVVIAQFLFTDASKVIGLKDEINNNGVAVADYDGDLDLDIFIVYKGLDGIRGVVSESRLYRNNGNGTFTNVTTESGLSNLYRLEEFNRDLDDFIGLSGYKYGAFWGDYDNDGYPDIFFTHLGKLQLFHNQKDGTFIEVTEAAGIEKYNDCGNTSASWFDFNNDGFLDIYINDWKVCDSNTFYQNNGDGTFTNVSNLIRSNKLATYTAFPFDFNNDNFLDLYVANDLSKSNQLFLNNMGQGFYNDQATNYGVDSGLDDMGISISDYDNDGDFDFFITAIDDNVLYTNQGDNTFVDNADIKNVGASGWAWGNTFADFNLDGDEDLFIANGFRFQARSSEFNVYYENIEQDNGEHTFNRFNRGVNENAISVEALDFDFDDDGDLDLMVTNSERAPFFYVNKVIGNPDNTSLKWFKVSLEGTVSNRDAIGTILRLNTSQGPIVRYYNGVGFLGQSLKPVHFGLEPNASIVSLSIKWPSGISETHTGLISNSRIKAKENEGYQVLNSTFNEPPRGCTDSSSCNYDSNAVIDDGSCSYLNVDGAITGTNNAGYFTTKAYSYPLSPNTYITWHVSGGEIISGQGTSSIRVKWGFNNFGKVSAVINNDDCNSEEKTLNVNLSLDNIDANMSIARIWNEALLDAIRNDFARPTVHARNLFHVSAAMYDAWAIFNNTQPYLIGNELNGFANEFLGFTPNPETFNVDLKKAMSYTAYRLLSHRFKNSPGVETSQAKFDLLMQQLNYSTNLTGLDYQNDDAVALGNYIADAYIQYGFLDGSREQTQYDNAYYEPVNAPLAPTLPGNVDITDPNRWQTLSLDTYIDQSGNLIEGTSIDFLSPEWGNVLPFAMTEDDHVVYSRDGNNYKVYNDPLDPPYLNTLDSESSEAYKWGFSLVSVWSAHLDPYDGNLWDISPKNIGNIDIEDFPTSYTQFPDFYDLLEGGDIGKGHSLNPVTGSAYETQMVPRGDYARVLAEFWADGPDSETPPGHWFTILNYVSDHTLLVKRFNGKGDVLEPLEWDVKSYFTLGGAMHDSAISAWSIKGWYDYIRPICAIRYMADLGQSTDATLSNYNENGIPLIDGYIEVVEEGEALSGRDNENVGKIKLFAWKGHSFINNTDTDEAGVGWILAENWWPYQRPSFVTPPFAGYVSGHSTYSRAAAEVMTLITGSEYFPGGMGEFVAKKDEFLVFEQGPSVDVVLQWATYRDASDQCSLSRIWGGIHPPADDIPGRIIGEKIGVDAFNNAVTYFVEEEVSTQETMFAYPNPLKNTEEITITNTSESSVFSIYDLQGRVIPHKQEFIGLNGVTKVDVGSLTSGMYILKSGNQEWKLIVR